MELTDPYEEAQKLLTELAYSINHALRYAPENDEDARRITVGNLLVECESAATVISVVHSVLRNPYSDENLKLVRARGRDRVLHVWDAVAANSRAGLLVNWVFHLEHFATLVSNALGLQEGVGRGGFNHRELLEHLNVPEADVRADGLLALQLIRNAQHNNGVHMRESRTLTVNGIDYEFEKGKAVLCAGWTHVVPLMRLSVDTLSQYLKSDAVSSIAHLEDPYSRQRGIERMRGLEELTQEYMIASEEE